MENTAQSLQTYNGRCCVAEYVNAYRRDKELAQKWHFANNAPTNGSMYGENPYRNSKEQYRA